MLSCLAVPDWMRILLQYAVVDAMHDASARFDAPRCSEGTRGAVQGDIMTWLELPINDLTLEQLRLLLWVTGAAGTGKSAILQTIAEKTDELNLLAASFFFSYKDPARNNAGRFIPTLAYQIAVKIPAVQEHVAKAIADDPSIFEKSLDKQMEVLIIEPISRLLQNDPSAPAQWPKLIIVDGLDECRSLPPDILAKRNDIGASSTDHGGQQQLDVLTLLHKSLVSRRLPFRVALASRPAMPMREFFSSGPGYVSTRQIVLNDAYNPGADIRLFLRSSFERIRAKHEVEMGWPRQEDIETLANNASGQFTYADTIVKFIDGPSFEPAQNLEFILKIAKKSAASLGSSSLTNPYSPLDDMYTAILNRCPVPKESIMVIHIILCTTFSTSTTWSYLPTAREINAFMQYRASDVSKVFGMLHSLMSIPPYDDTSNRYVFHHKSLEDFLYSPSRCGPDLYISSEAMLERISIQLLRLSGKGFNIRTSSNPKMQPCAPTCPYVVHADDCQTMPILSAFRDAQSSALFSTNHTHRRILNNGYRPTLLQAELDSMDAQAWSRERVTRTQSAQLEFMYDFVHNTAFGCRRFCCNNTCSRWRKAILRECIEKNWKVEPFFYRISKSPSFHPPITDGPWEHVRARLIPPTGSKQHRDS
ncbi:hypothetical protein FA15DRAFT_709221 [Coprinopsis marcescibilis]|uniref:Nephrocystin 3-like N-terminal domain-containing protein n=1 Tax=Coprinopsis marcescibilis TaxID=230819 RepID=A0A5C3KG96_COPMA|nr:hypothetical protein FA15DRAFT_709221 [Coprinopsis marcescibilis]